MDGDVAAPDDLDSDGPRRGRRTWLGIVVAVVLLAACLGVGWWLGARRASSSAATATCSVWWRPSTNTPPQTAGHVVVDLNEVTPEGTTHDQGVDAGKMRFAVKYANAEPFYGPMLSVAVSDRGGRVLSQATY